jgi:hypothetical protein
MKMKCAQMILLAGVLLAGCKKSGDIAADAIPPQDAAGHTPDFTYVEYFPQPNATQMKSRLSGADAQPLPGGLVVIKQLKLETFNTNGTPQAIVEAPECIYDMRNGAANSAGHLRLRSGDGRIRTEGDDGFLWQQTNSFLKISNHVHTVIETGTETKALL